MPGSTWRPAQSWVTIQEITAAEKINESHFSRVLRFTLLAPDIVEAILNGNYSGTLPTLIGPFPVEWTSQHETLIRGRCSEGSAHFPPDCRYDRLRAVAAMWLWRTRSSRGALASYQIAKSGTSPAQAIHSRLLLSHWSQRNCREA